MPVKIREEIVVAGKTILANIYKSESQRPLTKSAKDKANELDDLIEQKMRDIENEMEKRGLLSLKSRRGVLKLWYEVGKRLSFVETTDLVSAEDRKFIWRALHDHAGGLAPTPPHPGPDRPLNPRADEPRNHFRYCYLIARKFPDFDFVESVGDWSSWIDLLDSPTIQNDERILEWIASKQQSSSEDSRVDWLRKIINGIRHQFPAVGAMTDTTVFTERELTQKLESMYRGVFLKKGSHSKRASH
jgi:hypothetical protein